MTVLEAVEHDLAELERRRPGISSGALAAAARVLAVELDGGAGSTSKAMVARELRELMAKLAEVVPAAPLETRIDELASGRARRVARKSAAEG